MVQKTLILLLVTSIEINSFAGGCLSSCLKKATEQNDNVELAIAQRVRKNRSHKPHIIIVDETYRTHNNTLLISSIDYHADGTPITKTYCPIITKEDTEKLVHPTNPTYADHIIFRYGCY